MKVGDKINIQSLENGRQWDDMKEFHNAVSRNAIVWSWGANSWTQMSKYVLRFTVQGHHHKGHVYMAVNGADLFDVYLTTTRGTIKKIINDVYCEDIIDAIDTEVERVPGYKV